MAGLLSYVAAGATQGLGEGIVADGAARREAALKQYEEDREDQRSARAQNDVTDTFTDDSGNVNTVSKGGLVRNTGVKSAVKTVQDNKLVPVYDPTTKTMIYKPETEAAGMQVPPKTQAQPLPDRTLVPVWDPAKKANVWKPRSEAVGMEPAHTASQTANDGGLTEADNRLWGIVTKKHTTKDPDTGDETTDWSAVEKDLRARGRKDLADLAGDPPAEGTGAGTDDRSSKDTGAGYGDGTDPETNPALQKPAQSGGEGDLNANFQRNQAYVKPGAKNFATKLTPDGEKAFRAWVQKNKVPFDPTATGPQDYDMRGFYAALMSNDPMAKSAVDPNDSRLHYPDYWKTPYHATFSNESQWATQDAPKWNDKDQLVDKAGKVVFDDRAANAGKGKPPKGAGTQADPYQPTTQAEFDALPPNAVYLNPKDKKLYKKTAVPGK